MALTMTRTRTQTTLTRLVTQLANVKGELEFIRQLTQTSDAAHESLAVREAELEQHRAALVLTLKQFAPSLGEEQVGPSETWRKSFRSRTPSGFLRRYLAKTCQL